MKCTLDEMISATKPIEQLSFLGYFYEFVEGLMDVFDSADNEKSRNICVYNSQEKENIKLQTL